MLHISTAEAKAKLSGYLSLVELQGEEIVIYKRSKAVAKLVAIPSLKNSSEKTSKLQKLKVKTPIKSRFSKYYGMLKDVKLDPNYDYNEDRANEYLKKHPEYQINDK